MTEQRLVPRKALTGTVLLFNTVHGFNFHGTAINVSETGLGVFIPYEPFATEIPLTFIVDGVAINVTGKVRYHHFSLVAEQYRVGFKFLDLSAEHQQLIAAYVAA